MASSSSVRPRVPVRQALLALSAGALGLAGCGGGGDGAGPGAAAPTAAASAPTAVDDATRRRTAMAEQLYAGAPRVPEGFFLEPAPAGATGPVATLHLKNADLGAGATIPRHEVCSDDAAEALAWSETRASWQGSYSDLVETNASARMFELVRVPRTDTTARLRHRVFKCSHVDRTGTDLDADAGAAGTLKSLPVDAPALQWLAEYLWQFTAFNNADHVVLTTGAGPATDGQLAWRIEMARLTRAASGTDCDRIDRLAWTHAATVASGAMTRRLDTLETFRARRADGVAQLCPD